MTTPVVWLRRDLRLTDNPALLTAASASAKDGVCVAVVLDPARLRFVDFRLDVVQVGNSWRINGGQSEAVESC